MTTQNNNWDNKELIEFLTLSNNALRLENQRIKLIIMEELEQELHNIIQNNFVLMSSCDTNYALLNSNRKLMYDTALKYLKLSNKTVLIKALSYKRIQPKDIIPIVERALSQLRFELKLEVDIYLLKMPNEK